MIWYRKIGFNSNPFSIKPGAFYPDMVAYDLDFIFNKIESAEILFVEGEYGTGKTTILKSIISRFRKTNKIVYYSFNAGKRFSLIDLLNNANSVVRRLTGFKHRNIILLLDEVHTMNKSDAKEILKYYQSGVLQSVVFVTHDYSKATLPKEVESYLEGNVITTVPLSQKEAIELVETRLGEIDLFTNKSLKQIFKLADKNPRRFLAYCEDVARFAVEMEDYKVSDYHVESVLEEVIREKKKAAEKPAETQKKQPVKKEKKANAKEKQEPEEIIDKTPEEEPKIEIKEVEDKPKREKKFKVNKLVEGSKDPLGTVEASTEDSEIEAEKEDSDDEIPEYKVFVFEN